jgi:hypothetical protein
MTDYEPDSNAPNAGLESDLLAALQRNGQAQAPPRGSAPWGPTIPRGALTCIWPPYHRSLPLAAPPCSTGRRGGPMSWPPCPFPSSASLRRSHLHEISPSLATHTQSSPIPRSHLQFTSPALTAHTAPTAPNTQANSSRHGLPCIQDHEQAILDRHQR